MNRKATILKVNPLDPVKITYVPGNKYKTLGRQFQGIPGIEVAPSGRIWATWYSGGKTEGPENFVLIVTSADNGKSWSEPVAVIDPPGNVRAYDPTLWLDPSGRLWWFWAQCYSSDDGKIHDGRAGVWGVYTENPSAEHPVFSAPVRIANGVMMNKPVVLSSGAWALPTAVWEYFGLKLDELKNERFSNMTISTDNGKSFRLQGSADIPHRGFDEHMIVELKDGRLWMLVRTLYGIGQSFSADKGKKWSPGENSNIGGPNSRFFICRLSSGNLLLVNHADISPGEAFKLFNEGKQCRERSHLTACISDDDGKTWKGGLLIDERDEVSYPDGAQDKNGVIRIIYDHERVKQGNILMASFTEEDVMAGKCMSQGSNLKNLINTTGGLK
ncbi:MAG: glycoside hydrolase [Verrucomicrobia bacterium]|nr:glycoside hydrolase [Verrucomicrobiota bacterium]